MNIEVSIITPVYNSSEFIAACIKSVLKQTFINWEMILVDDLSTDNSIDIIQSFDDDRLKLIPLKVNSGPAIARNKAIELAQGKYIAFLDSDDLWLPEKLEKQLAFMKQNNFAITHTAYETIDALGNKQNKVIKAPKEITYNNLLNYNYIGCLTGMYNTDLCGKVYMPNIAKRQDYGLWLTLLKQGHKAYFLEDVLALYRTGRTSLSSNKWETAKYNWQLLRDNEKLSFAKASWHFLVYTFLGFKKYYTP